MAPQEKSPNNGLWVPLAVTAGLGRAHSTPAARPHPGLRARTLPPHSTCSVDGAERRPAERTSSRAGRGHNALCTGPVNAKPLHASEETQQIDIRAPIRLAWNRATPTSIN